MALTRVPGLLYGADYNPEQWPEAVWDEDVRLMREAGVNIVSLGIFSWVRVQPAPDRWTFEWLDRVMDLLAANGIAANLSTASSSPPQWLIRSHPEIVPVDKDGRRWSDNAGREHFCPSSVAYRDAVARYVEVLADRYGQHPALAMWHVNNEMHTRCFCDASAAHFRRWLQGRYGSLEALNDAWGTPVWGQDFDDWSEIVPARYMTSHPAQALDYARFGSAALLETFIAERDILRRVTPHVPVTNNWYGLTLRRRRERGTASGSTEMLDPAVRLDHWRWGAEVDVVASDEYPDPADPIGHVLGAIDYDLMRSIKGRPWIATEQTPGATAWYELNRLKEPGVARLWALQMAAHGADGIMFFQWRQSRFGPETFETGMVPHAGPTTPRWEEMVRLGADIGRLAEVAGARTQAPVAVMHDQESAWAYDQPGHPNDLIGYGNILVDWYRPLHERNVAIDFVHPAGDLARYKVVVIPNLFLVDEASAARIRAYVDGGGTVIVGAFSGIVDERLHAYLGGYPAPLRELLGIRIDEVWPQGAEPFGVRFVDGTSSAARDWCDAIELEAAEIVATFEGPLQGKAAVTRARHGRGVAWYVGTFLDHAGMTALLGQVMEEAGVTPVAEVPPGVEATRRERDGVRYLFLLNHGTGEVDVALASLHGRDLITDVPVDGGVRLTGRGVAVIREEPSGDAA